MCEEHKVSFSFLISRTDFFLLFNLGTVITFTKVSYVS